MLPCIQCKCSTCAGFCLMEINVPVTVPRLAIHELLIQCCRRKIGVLPSLQSEPTSGKACWMFVRAGEARQYRCPVLVDHLAPLGYWKRYRVHSSQGSASSIDPIPQLALPFQFAVSCWSRSGTTRPSAGDVISVYHVAKAPLRSMFASDRLEAMVDINHGVGWLRFFLVQADAVGRRALAAPRTIRRHPQQQK